MSEDKSIGCEEYLYKEMQCCLHPCIVQQCPEPICAMDFPGGIRAYQRFIAFKLALTTCQDIASVAAVLDMRIHTATSMYRKKVIRDR